VDRQRRRARPAGMTVAALPIGDYGVIGDLRTAALIGRDGSVDWLCLPRFDAMSVFGALLDEAKGGRWRIAPDAPHAAEQRYLPGTNVLLTAFDVPGRGGLEVVDFMPMGRGRRAAPRLVRWVRAVAGTVPVGVTFAPRFDYGTREPRLVTREHGLLATDRDNDAAALSAPAGTAWTLADAGAEAAFPLAAGEEAWFVLAWDEDEVAPVDPRRLLRSLDRTVAWWDTWLGGLRYDGPWREAVERSALALKLCCYEPTGAIVAAPTTSLPESRTGGRTWDYRYAWLRDSAFVLHALDALGLDAETGAFMRFLRRVCRREDGGHLQIMYAVDGGRDLPERILEHLAGWNGIGPVRVGNGAVDQFQMDVYGEVVETIFQWSRTRPLSEGTWAALRGLVDWVADHWREPDYSIWEPRGAPKHHVFSRIMAWVALDRGARIAGAQHLDGDVARWRREADAIHAEVLERGWDEARGTFVQAYGEDHLDAAALVVPKVGFLPRTDPRVRSTLAAVRRELAAGHEDLLYRYRGPDGLAGDEGAFLFVSFWMVQNLALVGEFDEAERLFRRLLGRASPLGLYAEEIEPATGEQLGNFPQALSHAALLNTAHILERLRPRYRP